MSKLVSIIIPCFNQEKFITDAIMSAENQTYKDIEIVFIDDCSTDGSLEVVNELKKKYTNIVVLKNETNLGVVDSRNKAIDVAKGFYILPLDGDDTIEPTYIENAVKVFEEKPDVGFVYCKARKFGAVNEYWNLPKFNKESFIFANCIVNSSLFKNLILLSLVNTSLTCTAGLRIMICGCPLSRLVYSLTELIKFFITIENLKMALERN